jgi:dihydroflavonol-4-reductase
VVALARSHGAAATIEGEGARVVVGDILDRATLGSLVDRADWVFHVAGVNEMCPKDPAHMDRVNIEGTANVLAACQVARVGRLIHTSSAAAIGERQGAVGTEISPHRGSFLSRYERSKHQAEQLVLAEAGALDVVVVNPSSVQGPGRATGTGKLLLDMLNGRLPFLVDTTVSIVDIDDCARGHLLAASNGVSGQRYLLSGASVGIIDAVALLSEVTGRTLRPRYLPGWVAAAGAGVVEFGSRVLGRQPKLCREMVRVMRAGHVYDGSRATRELGLQYRPLQLTIRRAVEWFETEGLLAH